MTKSPRKNVPDVGIELGAACMPSGHASIELPRPAAIYLISIQYRFGENGISFTNVFFFFISNKCLPNVLFLTSENAISGIIYSLL